MSSNNSFKPNLLRYTKAMAEKACHGFGSTTQVGLTQVLGLRGSFSSTPTQEQARMAHWALSFAGTKYIISVMDGTVDLAMDTGNKETSGFNAVPAERFLRSQRLQQHVRETFGDPVLLEVLSAAQETTGSPVRRTKA